MERLAARTSHPRWLLERWLARFTPEEVLALAEANNRTATLHLRVNRMRLDAKELIKQLARHDLVGTVGRWTEYSVGVEGEVDFAELDMVASGSCAVQDESETLVGLLVSPKPGQRVLDFCAAPGGKTTHLAELMGDQGSIVAVEKQPSRARVLEAAIQRHSLNSVQVIQGDATDMSWEEPFHRVLVDAPCSGLGVLARRADARWRKKPEIVRRMAGVQRELLKAAMSHVRRGGALVYSVCSFEPEETVEIVEWFLTEHPDFRIVSAKGYLADEVVSDLGALLCLPHMHGTDGVFAVRLERTEDYVEPS
jgi:16S rRNA (cytosine967-C5)-methyltransferase